MRQYSHSEIQKVNNKLSEIMNKEGVNKKLAGGLIEKAPRIFQRKSEIQDKFDTHKQSVEKITEKMAEMKK